MKLQRRRLGLRQQDVAEALGVNRATVAGWETGRGYPEAKLILPLAELLQITADELLKEPGTDKEAEATAS